MVPRSCVGTTITATLLGALATVAGCESAPEDTGVILATTTSTQDSGLLDVLVPVFERKTGYVLKTIAVGTGEALAMGGRGDADVLLVHAPEQERAVVASGAAINRRLVMHNDFLIVGPEGDPAGIHGSSSGVESVRRIAETGALFVSRGDDSGTHLRERSLWEAAGIDPGGDWYLSSGQGMGATLMIAAEKGAYTLTDRATHLSMREKTGLAAHAEGDPLFLNLYSVMEVNPGRFPGVNAAGARAFSEFMVGPEAQEIIREFGLEEFGQPLFVPDAGESEEALGGAGRDASPPGSG